jgi:hypothetical protein
MSASKRPRCRHCDRALLAIYANDRVSSESVQAEDGSLGTRTTRSRGHLLGYGYSATNYFCSLTCGWSWAVCRIRQEDKT